MASIGAMMSRLVDLFGAAASADPTKLFGNLMVSPAGNIVVGSSTDNGVQKLQVNGAMKVTGGITFNDGTTQTTAGGSGGTNLGLVLAMTNTNPIL